MSVFSVSAVSGALRFEPDHELDFNINKLNIIVEENAAVVGKGGRGGHGTMWASGSDLSIDGTGTDDVSAFSHEGESGGFAIGSVNMSTYFNVITISAVGGVYGGSGGGGGGNDGCGSNSGGKGGDLGQNGQNAPGGGGNGGGAGTAIDGWSYRYLQSGNNDGDIRGAKNN